MFSFSSCANNEHGFHAVEDSKRNIERNTHIIPESFITFPTFKTLNKIALPDGFCSGNTFFKSCFYSYVYCFRRPQEFWNGYKNIVLPSGMM